MSLHFRTGYVRVINKRWIMFRIALVVALIGCFAAVPVFADDALDRQLLASAKTGTAQQVEALIRQGANIEAQTTDGRTALCEAASGNNLAVVAVLLAKNANPNASTSDGRTSLMMTGSPPIAKLLIAHHANVDSRTADGLTALMYQGTSYSKEPALQEVMTTLLLANGADVNAVDSNGGTALFDAAGSGKLGIVRLLLKHGADVAIRNAKGVNAIDIAIFFAPGPPTPKDGKTTKTYHAIQTLLRAHGAVPSGPVVFQPLQP